MFESKINRGKANGYAPLGSTGKVPLENLPPIQSTLNTGSFATTGSNTFTGVQTLSGTSGTSWAEFTIGQTGEAGYSSYDLRATGSSQAGVSVTSDVVSLFGVITNEGLAGDVSFFENTKYGFPYSDGPIAAISVQKSGSQVSNWIFNYDGKNYFPSDITIGYQTLDNGLTSGSLNVTNGNINVSGSIFVSGNIYANNLTGSNGTSGTSGVNGANGSQGPAGSSFTWAGAWNSEAIYGDLNTVVEYQGSSYVCVSTATNLNRIPSVETGYWNLMAKSAFSGVDTGSFATTGSNSFKGNQSISGSVNISSSLVVSSTVVNNGNINALNSDLIIDGGDIILSGSLILSSSNIPTASTGSLGDMKGMLAIDDNFLYYNTSTYIPQITAGVYATAHAVNNSWTNDMYGNTTIFIQDNGINPTPQVGWIIQGSVNSATIVGTGYGVNHQNSGFGFMWLLQLNDIISFNSDDSVTLIEQTGANANWKRIAFESGSW